MQKVYTGLAHLVALLVVVQASLMVWGIAGLGIWVDDGGVLDKQTFEDAFDGGEKPFTEFTGLMLHGMNGMMLIPAVALILVIVSFFAKVPQGVQFALAVLGLVVIQVMLGLFGHEVSALGALHGINALLLFSTALYTGLRVKKVTGTEAPSASVTA